MDVKDSTHLVRTPTCGICKQDGVVEVPSIGFLQWNFGMLIQDALPDLDIALREQMMSGTHPKCWEIMTQDEEDTE
jgi:hypothetical protein